MKNKSQKIQEKMTPKFHNKSSHRNIKLLKQHHEETPLAHIQLWHSKYPDVTKMVKAK